MDLEGLLAQILPPHTSACTPVGMGNSLPSEDAPCEHSLQTKPSPPSGAGGRTGHVGAVLRSRAQLSPGMEASG